jgi:hypothetical protein
VCKLGILLQRNSLCWDFALPCCLPWLRWKQNWKKHKMWWWLRDQLEGTLLAGMYLPLLSKSICNVNIHVPSSLSKKNCNCALLWVVERTCLLLTQRRSRP